MGKVNPQNLNSDSIYISKHFGYFSISLLSGVDLVIPHKDNQAIGLNFPYQITDSSGTVSNKAFGSQNKRIYHSTKLLVFPIDLEVGGRSHFFNTGIVFQIFPNGYTTSCYLSAGYGFIWHLNCFHNNVNKKYVLKTSVNIAYNVDGGGNSSSQLGSIDNENVKINLLGYTANPTYTIQATKHRSGGTFSAKNLDVSYSQKEFSLLPKISISNNPYNGGQPINAKKYSNRYYVGKIFWEFSLGYNISLYDKGGIIFTQDDGNLSDKTNKIAGPVSLDNKTFTFYSNNKATSSTPYSFSGLYISFVIRPGRSWIN